MTILRCLYLMVLLYSAPSIGLDLDNQLSLIREVYNLTPKSCDSGNAKTNHEKRLRQAGELLFNSKSLSGNRDTSCTTCHIDSHESSDGLPMSVGVGGVGEGTDRMVEGHGAMVQRNAFSLKGRADKHFTAYFWDGKAQSQGEKFITQFGDYLPKGFESLLAVASILPLMERDEFIGQHKLLADNDIENTVEDRLYFDRYIAVEKAIQRRLADPTDKEDRELREKLSQMDYDIADVDLVNIGNALAAFIQKGFPCTSSSWDSYLAGDKDSISYEQKRGAVIFYGKGRCASCHSGNFNTDFKFHSIGTPQGFFGPHTRHRDVGRASVTHRNEDLYQFRTPPLNDVARTPPYGHSGAFKTLQEAVEHHINPVEFYISNPDFYKADYYILGKIIGSRSSLLSHIDIYTEKEIGYLVEFLKSL